MRDNKIKSIEPLSEKDLSFVTGGFIGPEYHDGQLRVTSLYKCDLYYTQDPQRQDKFHCGTCDHVKKINLLLWVCRAHRG